MRIAPIEPPYTNEVQESFDKIMPKGMPPLAIFRVLAHNPRVLRRIQRGGLLDPGSITVRHRQLVILRTCALCGAVYEWGVHAKLFGPLAELTQAELDATWTHGSAAEWSETERLVLRLAERLHTTSTLDDALAAELAACFSHAAIIELVTLAGLYHAVSYVVNAFEIEPEPFAIAPPVS